MYVTNADFIREWNKEAILTQNVLDGLTDDSLKQLVYPEGRTLGRIAWHLITSIPEYLAHFGLKIDRGWKMQKMFQPQLKKLLKPLKM